MRAIVMVGMLLIGCDNTEPLVAGKCQAILNGEVDHEHESVVMVRSANQLCSGTLMGSNQVLTARHCEAKWIESEGKIVAIVIGRVDHPYYDVSALELDRDLALPTTELGTDVRRGDKIIAVGYGRDCDGSVGIRQSITTAVKNVTMPYIELDSMNPGDSGGAILRDGKLVGVITNGRDDGLSSGAIGLSAIEEVAW